ncbi:hypothetical protein [Companilactobacillus keshanensis]|uniref:Lipoprotein n=1 Tax=Companilactobacillus keshanensis TaxID=2486003 RepID=A0ABW4BUV5_9LACO|nr:hypothetical protein [Companilactobacillus keshanensis]
MKKLINTGLLLAVVFSLTGCSNSNKQSSNMHKKDTTTAIKKKAVHKKKAKKEKIKKSDPTTNDQTSNQTSSNKPAQTTQSNQQTQPSQQSSGISYDENTLSGFVNKYGMSPAAYKMQNNGMSAYDALKSTPDSMETFGEQQSESQMDRGLMDHNGNMTDKGMQWENHTDDQSDQDYDQYDSGY